MGVETNNNALTIAEGAWERVIDLTTASGSGTNQLVSQSSNVIIPEYMTVNALGVPDVWAVIIKSSTGNSTVKDVIARMWEQL